MIVNNASLERVYHILYRGTKEGVKGTRIEQYYNDFKHVRIVPYQDIIKKIPNYDHDFADAITLFKHQQNTAELDDLSFLDNPAGDTAQYSFRKLLKMHWLVSEIQKNGLREPITGVVHPRYDIRNKLELQLCVHPGSFRWKAYQIMDINPPCIIFDAYDLFVDHPKASLDDLLELFNDNHTEFEISMLPNNDSFLTPQILNSHSAGYNCNMMNALEDWYYKTKHMWFDDINIFIGYDSTHLDAANVCHNSIEDACIVKFGNRINIRHIDVSSLPEYTREYKNQSTEFAYSRFLVPYLSGYKGISIFVDDDFVFTENILNMLYFLSPEHSVACVKHDFQKKHDTKFNGTKDVWYKKKLWSSLMIFNNSHPDCKKLTPDVINTAEGSYLHQFQWTEEERIGSIPKKWNWCEGYDSIDNIHEARGLHFTRGGPWIEDMNCDHIQGLEVYDAYRLRGRMGHNESEFPRYLCSFINMREYYDLDSSTCYPGETQKDCIEIKGDSYGC